MSVTLLELWAAARARHAPLVGEIAGYLLLGVADQVVSAPRSVRAGEVELRQDGAVQLVGGTACSDVEAEHNLRQLLQCLLQVARSSPFALTRVSRRPARNGMHSLVRELEAALIPVNRAAGRRALSRLCRETARGLESGAFSVMSNLQAQVESHGRAEAEMSQVSPRLDAPTAEHALAADWPLQGQICRQAESSGQLAISATNSDSAAEPELAVSHERLGIRVDSQADAEKGETGCPEGDSQEEATEVDAQIQCVEPTPVPELSPADPEYDAEALVATAVDARVEQAGAQAEVSCPLPPDLVEVAPDDAADTAPTPFRPAVIPALAADELSAASLATRRTAAGESAAAEPPLEHVTVPEPAVLRARSAQPTLGGEPPGSAPPSASPAESEPATIPEPVALRARTGSSEPPRPAPPDSLGARDVAPAESLRPSWRSGVLRSVSTDESLPPDDGWDVDDAASDLLPAAPDPAMSLPVEPSVIQPLAVVQCVGQPAGRRSGAQPEAPPAQSALVPKRSDVTELVSRFRVAGQKAEAELCRDLKTMVGIDVTPLAQGVHAKE